MQTGVPYCLLVSTDIVLEYSVSGGCFQCMVGTLTGGTGARAVRLVARVSTQSIRNRPFAVVQHHHHFVDNTVPLVQLENKSVGIGGEVLEYGGIDEVQEEAGNVEGVVLTDPSAVVFLQVQPWEKECNAEINVCK